MFVLLCSYELLLLLNIVRKKGKKGKYIMDVNIMFYLGK